METEKVCWVLEDRQLTLRDRQGNVVLTFLGFVKDLPAAVQDRRIEH